MSAKVILDCKDLTQIDRTEIDVREKPKLLQFVDNVFKRISDKLSRERGVSCYERENIVRPFLQRKITLNDYSAQIAKVVAKVDVQGLSLYISGFNITSEKDLVDIVKASLRGKVQETAKAIQNFGITNQESLVEIAALCADRDVNNLLSCLKCFRITDQEGLVFLAKVCASIWKSNLISYINDFGITNKNDLLDILKLRASVKVTEVLLSIRDLGLTDEKMVIDLIKYCVTVNCAAVIKHIKKLRIKDQDTLFDIAMLCAQTDGDETSLKINNLGISNEKRRALVAIECAKINPYKLIENLENFRVEDKKLLFVIAKTCTTKGGSSLVVNIKKFKIDKKSTLFKLAKICAASKRSYLAYRLHDFKVDKMEDLIELAKLCIVNDTNTTVRNISNFGIKDEQVLIEIAKLGLQASLYDTAIWIDKFKIENKETLIAIGWIIAKRDPGLLARVFKKLKVEDEEVRIEFATFCIKSGDSEVIQEFSNFNISKQEDLIAFANLSYMSNKEKTAKYFSQFQIECEKTRYDFAKKLAIEVGERVLLHYRQFGIKDNVKGLMLIELAINHSGPNIVKCFSHCCYNFNLEERVKIALRCAKKNAYETAKKIRDFRITDNSYLYQIFIECLCQSDMCILEADKFTKCSRINRALKSKTPYIINYLPCTPINIDKVFKVYHDIVDNESPFKSKMITWFDQSIYLMDALDKEDDLDWMIASSFWDLLKNIRFPDLRSKLTGLLYKISQDEEYRNFSDSLLDRCRYKRPQLSLMIVALFLLKTSGLCAEKISEVAEQLNRQQRKKRSRLRDIHKIYFLLDTIVLLGSTGYLTEKERVKGFERIFYKGGQVCTEDNILKNVRSAYALLLFKNVDWLVTNDPLEVLVTSCFKDLILLKSASSESLEKMHKTFDFNSLSYLITYSSGLKSIKETDTLHCFAGFIQDVVDESFLTTRYDTENNPHLEQICKARPDLIEKWKRNLTIPLDTLQYKGDAPAEFNASSWLKTKLFIDNHLDGVKLPILSDHFGRKEDPPQDPDSCKDLLQFQKVCLELIDTDASNHPQLIRCLKEMKKIINALYPESEFINDLKGLVETLSQPGTSNNSKDFLVATVTDNPRDLSFSGTDVSGSCQRLDGTPKLNKCLMGYVIDGKNMLLAVKNGRKIKCRCFLRLLWDGEEPVLYMDRFYPSFPPERQALALTNLAKMRAKELGLPLTSHTGQKRYDKVLEALGGPAPYEYADGNGGICADGKFTVKVSFLISQ